MDLSVYEHLNGEGVLVTGFCVLSMRTRAFFDLTRDEEAQHAPHQRDHGQAADVLGEGELPADQHP